MRKLLIAAGAAVLIGGAGAGTALAAPAPSTGTAVTHAVTQVAHPQASPTCPPNSQAGRHGNTVSPPCGVLGGLPVCPTNSTNAGSPPPCSTNGQGQGPTNKPTSQPTTQSSAPPACGPADQGGSPDTGQVTQYVYQVGEAISSNGGAQLGDPVQSIACALNGALGI